MKKLKLLAQLPEEWKLGAAGGDAGAAADTADASEISAPAGDMMIVIDGGAFLNEDPFVILPPEDDLLISIDDGAFLGAYIDENGNLVVPDNGRMMDGWDGGNWCILPIWDGGDFVIGDPVLWIEEPVGGGEAVSEPADETGEDVPVSDNGAIIGAHLDENGSVAVPGDGDVLEEWDGGWWCELPVWEGGEVFPVDGPAGGGEVIAILPENGGEVSDPEIGTEVAGGGEVMPDVCICYPPEFFVV